MKQIIAIDDVNIGDYILYQNQRSERVYVVRTKEHDLISNRELVYSSDGDHSNYPIDRGEFGTNNINWYILNSKEINHYLKLLVFK